MGVNSELLSKRDLNDGLISTTPDQCEDAAQGRGREVTSARIQAILVALGM